MRSNAILQLFVAIATFAPTTDAGAHEEKSAVTVTAANLFPASAAATAVDAFHAALQRGDGGAAAAQLADDALIYESGGVERGKAEYASHHLAADAKFAKATTRVVMKRSGRTNGDFAWVATESTTKGTYRDRAINSVSTETMVLRRQNGAWRIVHVHWSSANVK